MTAIMVIAGLTFSAVVLWCCLKAGSDADDELGYE